MKVSIGHWNQSFSHVTLLNTRTYRTLMIAAYRGYTEIFDIVLGRQEEKIYAKGQAEEKIGMEALYNAVRSGHTCIAKILLDYGVDVDCKAKSAGKRNSMLNVSIDEADENMAQLLLSYKADPNVRVLTLYNEPERESILAQAYRRGKFVIIKLLEAEARTFENPVWGRGNPLHFAATYNDETLLETLLECGATVQGEDWSNDDKGTPLHYAAKSGSLAIINRLIVKGAEINSKDVWGRTPIHYAAQNGHTEIIQALLHSGANLGEKENKGQTIIHRAAAYGKESVPRLLIERGLDPNKADSEEKKPLHLARVTMS